MESVSSLDSTIGKRGDGYGCSIAHFFSIFRSSGAIVHGLLVPNHYRNTTVGAVLHLSRRFALLFLFTLALTHGVRSKIMFQYAVHLVRNFSHCTMNQQF